MARIKTYKTEALVLKQIPLGEADRILTLYTPDLGEVRAVAKGVRRPSSKLAGHLELLSQVAVSMSPGRDLDVVNEAQVVRSFTGLREDLSRLSRAFYVAELVNGFSIERSPNYPVYQLLEDTLQRLESGERPDLALRYFEVHLLSRSGYRPDLYSCVECRSSLEPADHLFTCAGGGVLCVDCRASSNDLLIPVSVNSMKVLRFLLREESYGAVSGLKMSDSLGREVERLTRVYIRYVIERDLKSVDFMNLVGSSGAGQ